jgi:hypothetical protein
LFTVVVVVVFLSRLEHIIVITNDNEAKNTVCNTAYQFHEDVAQQEDVLTFVYITQTNKNEFDCLFDDRESHLLVLPSYSALKCIECDISIIYNF